MTKSNPGRFILRELAFTGPHAEVRRLSCVPGINVVWGASNAGKSFIVRAIDFMLGAKPARLPPINERQSYDRGWLTLDLPKSGRITLSRATSGGDYDLFVGDRPSAADAQPTKTLAARHASGTDNLSGFLLAELGVVDKKIAKNQYGDKTPFSIRHFAPYLLTEETDMIGEASPIKISEYRSPVLERNVLKFIITGIDDSAIVVQKSIEKQRTANLGKLELVDEMIARIEKEVDANPDGVKGLQVQEERLSESIGQLHAKADERRRRLDELAVERRSRKDGIQEAKERHLEIALMIERFDTLNRVYESDVQRLESLEEGGAALLASASRPCPLCGAEPEHQSQAHGLEDVKLAQQAAQSEIIKIRMERSDLAKTVGSLSAESDGLIRKAARLVEELDHIEAEIKQIRPQEGALREQFNALFATRETVRSKLATLHSLDELRATKAQLEAFKARGISKKGINTGISTVTGHELAKCVQDVLHAWQFPGSPAVSFSETSHDILIDGKSRQANGKGVRALMNAAFKKFAKDGIYGFHFIRPSLAK